MSVELARLETIVDNEGVAEVLSSIESKLPIGVRPRQLKVRTLVLGILVAQADGRRAHLTRVHQALLSLSEAERWRLGVVVSWRGRAHALTYRQIERSAGLLMRALEKPLRDGTPSALLQQLCDALAEASVPEAHKQASSSLAVDWTDIESFARPPLEQGGPCADPEASWGHRRGKGPGQKDELFFGYLLSLATMVRDEGRAEVPELVRRMLTSAYHVDAPAAFAPVLVAMPGVGTPLGDVLCDSGYAHRVPGHWALPLRRAGANLVMDLHPHDRGPRGTHEGAIICNGSLYCPCTAMDLLALGPPARDASASQLTCHDQLTAEADHYRLRRISADDCDGYHRVMCPALSGKLRCPLRPDSLVSAVTEFPI